MHERRAGFTLIELLIAVLIISILAVATIPNLTASRVASNESSAISSLRVLHSVNENYRSRFGTYGSNLGDLAKAGYIDSALGSGTRSGYDFSLTGLTATWGCTADPVSRGETGERCFFIDTSGVIRFETTGSASASSCAID